MASDTISLGSIDQERQCVDLPDKIEEKSPSSSPSPPPRGESRRPPRIPSPPKSGENRLRPAGGICALSLSKSNVLMGWTDIINRINWDPTFQRDDYIIGFVDRFEGQLEVSMNAWKKDSTDEEFIPQHRVLYIRHVDGEVKKPSLPRLATNIPLERHSSTSLPVLAPKIPPEINMQQRPRSERQAIAPFLFAEDRIDDENIAPTARYAPDAKPVYVTRKSIEEDSPVTQKTMYYEDAFALQAAYNPPKDRVVQDSAVIAELATNRKAKEEDSRLVSDIASRLAQIYQRPESAVQVAMHPDISIVFANVFLPSYLLKIYALPASIAPVTNLRNTGLIQRALQDLLGIPPEQGVVLYLPVPEENLATNGSTAQREISRLDHTEADSPGLIKSISRTMSRRLKSSSGGSAPLSLPSTVMTTSPSTLTNSNQSPLRETAQGEDKPRGRTLKKRESLRSIVRRRLMDIKPRKEGDIK
ncbi:uncharacterized protein N7482_006260 [Penicillium canariense]|uniref:L-dopachrome isomerase n=1 Tax=Penicillium canariense TaxID=189055 RepID=A0A9W9I6C6_9EURO|nr:uncharacterized protein N7482_006260 [Penicillium canariense]KAJ5167479.1 hypothetical protein N7482_006260 [Penicillium canariense]